MSCGTYTVLREIQRCHDEVDYLKHVFLCVDAATMRKKRDVVVVSLAVVYGKKC